VPIELYFYHISIPSCTIFISAFSTLQLLVVVGGVVVACSRFVNRHIITFPITK